MAVGPFVISAQSSSPRVASQHEVPPAAVLVVLGLRMLLHIRQVRGGILGAMQVRQRQRLLQDPPPLLAPEDARLPRHVATGNAVEAR